MPNPFSANQFPYISNVLYPSVESPQKKQKENNTKNQDGKTKTRASISLRATSGEVDYSIARGRLSQEDINKILADEAKNGRQLETAAASARAQSNDINARAVSNGRFTEVDRSPFVITCQSWLSDSKKSTREVKNQSKKDPLKSFLYDTNFVQQSINDINMRPDNPKNPTKAVTSQESSKIINELKYIFCNVNPSQAQWSFPIRAVDQKTMGGRVQHVWRNYKRRDSYFDEPVIKFTFQSGNLLPLKFVSRLGENGQLLVNRDPGVPGGLANFYKFFELFNQPRIIGTGGNRQANTTYIFYNSRVYPKMVISGMWEPEGLSFSESADKPNEIEWSASFVVYETYPKFENPAQLVESFVKAGFGSNRVTDGARNTKSATQSNAPSSNSTTVYGPINHMHGRGPF